MHAKNFSDVGIGEERLHHRTKSLDGDVPHTPKFPPDVLPNKATRFIRKHGLFGRQDSQVPTADLKIFSKLSNMREAWARAHGNCYPGMRLDSVGGRVENHAKTLLAGIFASVVGQLTRENRPEFLREW
jgi:hypothetical protein